MYEWINEHAATLKGATMDFKAEWNAERFLLGDKMFAMKGGDKEGRPILTMKCDPDEALRLREKYPEKIVPGYYMNKKNWNSVYLESDVPHEEILRMLENAYGLLMASLSKKKQAELLGD